MTVYNFGIFADTVLLPVDFTAFGLKQIPVTCIFDCLFRPYGQKCVFDNDLNSLCTHFLLHKF